MTSLNSKLQLALLNRKKSRNLLEKGFTLVELMIVIVIVGVLSAVALPNFLSQTSKAKGTEARSQISSIIKGASAAYLEGGDTKVNADIAAGDETCPLWGAPVAADTKFDYVCTFVTPNLKVTATGNANDGNLEDAAVVQEINLDKGTVSAIAAETSQMFGGALANP